MRRFTFLIFLAAVLASLAFGKPFNQCDELNAFWRQQVAADFKVDWPIKRFACPSSPAKIARAFQLLWLSSDEENFYSWAKKHIGRVAYTSKCDTKGRTAQMLTASRVMQICPRFAKVSDSSRSAAIFHEAAHTIKGDPSHVTCNHGVHKGQPGTCDEKFFGRYHGSGYNYEFQYLWRVLHHSKRNSLSKAEIRAALKALAWNKFNLVNTKVMNEWLEEASLPHLR